MPNACGHGDSVVIHIRSYNHANVRVFHKYGITYMTEEKAVKSEYFTVKRNFNIYF